MEYRNWSLYPMVIGSLWALVNDEPIRERIYTVLGQEGGDHFIGYVRQIAASF